MGREPLISVIMPTYNHGHLIGRCLKSVLDQTFTDWEAIVVNNFSEDNTVEVVNGFDDRRISLVNFSNYGVIARSRNNGIERAKGQYIAFLDSDDWWYPEKLEVVTKYLTNSDVVYHDLDIYTHGSKKNIRKIKGRHLKKPVFVDLMRNGNALANSSVVIRKAIIDKVGGVCEKDSLVATEDFDLWLKIARNTDNFTYIPRSLGAYWVGGGNVTEASEKGIGKVRAVYRVHLEFLSRDDRDQAKMIENYIVGRKKQKMGLLEDALSLFKISIGSRNIEIKIKSLVLFVYIGTVLTLKRVSSSL